jgi:Ser/Thr protein kinase RdoA (MazF antagonist)
MFIRFSIILVSEQLLAAADEVSEEELEIILAYEIANLVSKRQFGRGEMEKEIYKLLSLKQDPAVRIINHIYTTEIVSKAESKLKDVVKSLHGTSQSIMKVT